MNIYHDLETTKLLARSYAEDHNCNYNIILLNPNENGEFGKASTYEIVRDSYFEKERPNAKILFTTDELTAIEPVGIYDAERAFNLYNPYYPAKLAGMASAFSSTPQRRPPQYIGPKMKIGRNHPCHCDSGKKYKYCCLV